MHILLIKYFDKLMQLVSCYETKGDIANFPYLNFLKKFKKRIPFIEDCFNNIDDPDFMKHCYVLCNKFDFMKLSPFHDGDVKLVKRVYLSIYSFLRKFDLANS